MFKERLAQALTTSATAQNVFLWRGDTGETRKFRDADAPRDRLETDGWCLVDVTAPLAAIGPLLAGAQVVEG